MAYTSFEKMRRINSERFGKDLGPFQPHPFTDPSDRTSLKAAALAFIRNNCENLFFSPTTESIEDETGLYRGTGIASGQIPFNMQMDINRLCLEKELASFIDSGTAEDAYTVYYCFMEMIFGHYGKSQKMIELLSEFESNGSSLLMKHRDHFSHSVYVFALGLALYETNPTFRDVYRSFYQLRDDGDAARSFLTFWGLASLFHDIGYPFELPFEQVMSYFEVGGSVKRGKDTICLAYTRCNAITDLSDDIRARLKELCGRDFTCTNELFAFSLAQRLGDFYGFTEEKILDILNDKPSDPGRFGYFIDHAWFSATRLFDEMVSVLGAESITGMHIDSVTAILLHNSLYKFDVAYYKDPKAGKPRLRMQWHPLAFMLMLCDELQCWDRTAYGRNSRTELHPMDVRFCFTAGSIKAEYLFDSEEQDKIQRYEEDYRNWIDSGREGNAPRLKAYSDMASDSNKFVSDIKKVVDLSDLDLEVSVKTEVPDRSNKHTYLSNSNFLHLYDFAVALHNRYSYDGMEAAVNSEQMENEFESISLEYQLSTINQAKAFSRYLNAIHCFFTDKPVNYEMVNEFTPDQTEIFAPLEHERWVLEHHDMAWTAGDEYETADVSGLIPEGVSEKTFRRALREQFRRHKLMADPPLNSESIYQHYLSLSEEDQGKDWKPFNSMLKLIKKFDGLRIYRLP